LWGYFSTRKRHQEVLHALKRLRKKYSARQTIYLILDNFSPHRRPEIQRWAKENNVVFVWTPTNASWLNRIECQFTELKKFSLDNVFYKTHTALQRAMRKFLRYRNKRNKLRKTKHKIT
jgi:transposase